MINNTVVANSVATTYGNKKDLQISTDNLHKFFSASIDIYSNKFRFLTEIVSNAYDATVEKAVELEENVDKFVIDNPIVLKVSKNNGKLTVSIKETWGVGITPNRVDDVFIKLNKSTKESSDLFIGQKGKGRLSTLAYGTNVEYITVFNNVKYSYTWFKNQEIINEFGEKEIVTQPYLVENYQLPTSEKNGTEVLMNIDSDDENQLYEEISNQLMFFNNVVYDFPINKNNLEKELNDTILYDYDSFIISSRDYKRNNSLVVLLNKVPYKLTQTPSNSDLLEGVNLFIKMEASSLTVNESREDLIYGKVWEYLDEDFNHVKISEALENGKLKEGYSRVKSSVLNQIEKQIDVVYNDFKVILESQKETTDNFLTYTKQKKDYTIKLKDGINYNFKYGYNKVNDELKTTLKYENEYISNLIYNTKFEVKKNYSGNFCKPPSSMFNSSSSKVKEKDIYNSYGKDTLFVNGRKKDFIKNRYIKQEYNIGKVYQYNHNTENLSLLEKEVHKEFIRCYSEWCTIDYDSIVVPQEFIDKENAKKVRITSTPIKVEEKDVEITFYERGYRETLKITTFKTRYENVLYFLPEKFKGIKDFSGNFTTMKMSNTSLKKLKKHLPEFESKFIKEEEIKSKLEEDEFFFKNVKKMLMCNVLKLSDNIHGYEALFKCSLHKFRYKYLNNNIEKLFPRFQLSKNNLKRITKFRIEYEDYSLNYNISKKNKYLLKRELLKTNNKKLLNLIK